MSDDDILQEITIQRNSPNDIGTAMEEALNKYIYNRDMMREYAYVQVKFKHVRYEGKYDEWYYVFQVWSTE